MLLWTQAKSTEHGDRAGGGMARIRLEEEATCVAHFLLGNGPPFS